MLYPTSFACQSDQHFVVSSFQSPRFIQHPLHVRTAFCRFLFSITTLYPTSFACQSDQHFIVSSIQSPRFILHPLHVRPAFYRFLNSITFLFPHSNHYAFILHPLSIPPQADPNPTVAIGGIGSSDICTNGVCSHIFISCIRPFIGGPCQPPRNPGLASPDPWCLPGPWSYRWIFCDLCVYGFNKSQMVDLYGLFPSNMNFL